MKKLFLLPLLLIFCLGAKSQITEGSVQINKSTQPAIIANFNYPKDVVEDAMADFFAKANLGKSRKFKGFQKFEGIVFQEIANERIDLYYKVSSKNKRSQTSTVHLLISKGYDNFISSGSNPEAMTKAKDVMASLVTEFEAKALNNQIEAQQKVVDRAERDLKSLYSEGENLKSRIKKLQDDLEDNAKKQENQSDLLKKEKQALEELKAKQK
ncbi:MAG: hypothetical protein ACOXZ9_02890 [Bacteroidales bacterium]